MSNIRPLSGQNEAQATLAHRLTCVADRLRGLNTRFGLRSKRVFLVWTKWTGNERGEGDEHVIAEVELLPTPKVSDLNAIARRPYSAGVFPEGSLLINEISAGAYTEDVLTGLAIPTPDTSAPHGDTGRAVNGKCIERGSDKRIDFWFEIMEDGRGDDIPRRRRFRPFGAPNRSEGSLYYSVTVEVADEARNRSGAPQIGVNEVDLSRFGGG